MKIKYLGTAASEGVPAVFCNCDFCNYARKAKGKELRSRAQAVVDDSIMIDFGPDTYSSAQIHGVDLSAIGALLITHTHADHFAPLDLCKRGGAYAHNMVREKLIIYCGKEGVEAYQKQTEGYMAASISKDIILKEVKPFEPFWHENYEITFLTANHKIGGEAYIISITRGDKSLLYCNDTGQLPKQTFSYLKEKRLVFDFIGFDCTNIGWAADANGIHMGFDDIKIVENKLIANGQITPSTQKIVTHFSHNVLMPHKQLEKRAVSYGYTSTYDGVEYKF